MEIAVTLVVAIISTGILTVAVQRFADRAKTQAEADNLVGDTYADLLERMQSQLDRMDAELHEQRAENAALSERVGMLEGQIAELNELLRDERELVGTLIAGINLLRKQILTRS